MYDGNIVKCPFTYSYWLNFIECFMTTFLRAHSWLNWVDENDDEDEVGLKLLVKWEVVSPNSRYREFYHEIGNIANCPFTYWLNGEVVSPNRRYSCREF